MGFYVHDKIFNHVQIRVQKQIEALEQWCKKCHIKLIATKTQLICFNSLGMKVKVYGQTIKSCTSATLLGTTIGKKLLSKKHISNLAAKGQRRLGMMRCLQGWGASRETLRNTYLTFIRPVL